MAFAKDESSNLSTSIKKVALGATFFIEWVRFSLSRLLSKSRRLRRGEAPCFQLRAQDFFSERLLETGASSLSLWRLKKFFRGRWHNSFEPAELIFFAKNFSSDSTSSFRAGLTNRKNFYLKNPNVIWPKQSCQRPLSGEKDGLFH
ncbi:hypothetical protein NEPTK9_000402 [Candidatus Neptunochlamydia vexilliferae]|uniref:Uncharacterized protein n=1 Tax=Candidatus Neptunichlamydia vexilliferae TaxID=1651774 RepID=A0ABS0AXP3_9BACT|nr:hypothetical protein [Candidatus Neptunochlamydia vexilliferae]